MICAGWIGFTPEKDGLGKRSVRDDVFRPTVFEYQDEAGQRQLDILGL